MILECIQCKRTIELDTNSSLLHIPLKCSCNGYYTLKDKDNNTKKENNKKSNKK